MFLGLVTDRLSDSTLRFIGNLKMLVFEHLVACVRPALPWATASMARKARRKCGIVYLFVVVYFVGHLQ